jgi:transcriptional regulator with XRE-family HTH domain
VTTIYDMPRRTLSPHAREALQILATLIRGERLRRGWTEAGLAERVGVSRATIVAVEAAKPGVAIGTMFEAAALLDVALFSPSPDLRDAYRARKDAELALLPAVARPRSDEVDDDF